MVIFPTAKDCDGFGLLSLNMNLQISGADKFFVETNGNLNIIVDNINDTT